VATPKKQLILDGVITKLQGITISLGYQTDAGMHVHQRREHIEDPDEGALPALYVFAGSEDAPTQAMGATCHTRQATFVVTGYAQDRDDDLVSEMIKLEADIVEAMLTDLTQGGTALDTVLLYRDTDWSEFAPLGRGITELGFGITYQWTVADP
jgi:hypothetical protein